MTAIPFDTHNFVERLRTAGVPNEQALAHKDALKSAAFATKDDIEKLEIKMKAENDKLNTKMDILLIGFALLIGLLAIPQVAALFQ